MRGSGRMSGELKSSFLSCEKDLETIIRKLFVDSRPYSDELKRLLIINNKDCLRDRTNQDYIKKINSMNVSDLIEQGYIKTIPIFKNKEHEEDKNRIFISFDGFEPTLNNEYRNCIVEIDIICNTDNWDLGNYQVRPLKIAGYIDGILNNSRLSGIGTLKFSSCNELLIGSSFSGYCLMYTATHGADDIIPEE